MHLKNIILFTFILFSFAAQAQTTITTNKILDKKPVFVGGGLVLGGGANSFQMGLNPEIIKSFTPYLDGGLAMNIYYELYKEAKKKAKTARDLALSSYLEAKRIKNTYLLDENDSDESDLDENFTNLTNPTN
jgi:hypothetical protein